MEPRPLRSLGEVAPLAPFMLMLKLKKEDLRLRAEPGVSGKGELGSRTEEVVDSAVWRGSAKGVASEG